MMSVALLMMVETVSINSDKDCAEALPQIQATIEAFQKELSLDKSKKPIIRHTKRVRNPDGTFTEEVCVIHFDPKK